MTGLVSDTAARLLEDRAAATPDATMVVDERHRRRTFGDLRDGVERTAAGLLARGVRPGDVVSWQLPNRIETIILALALARLGAVQNPLVMMLRERELGFICRQANSRWLAVPGMFRGVDHEAMARAVAQSKSAQSRPAQSRPAQSRPAQSRPARSRPGPEILLIDGELPAGDPATLPDVPGDGADMRWIFYTSGTTSDAKGAKHTDRGLIAASGTFCANLALEANDVVAALLPLAHVGGILHILSSLRTGSSMITSAVFDPETTPDLLAEHGVTLVGSGLPFIGAYLARQRAQAGPLFPRPGPRSAAARRARRPCTIRSSASSAGSAWSPATA
jgi:acyl-CoA synthetase (AMP-forming)/AMP-acid ligase II